MLLSYGIRSVSSDDDTIRCVTIEMMVWCDNQGELVTAGDRALGVWSGDVL